MIRQDFLPFARPHITNAEIEAITEVVLSGWWTTGDKVSQFEEKLSEYLLKDSLSKSKIHTLALNSCTSALHLALLVLGVEAGDEVIVPTWTFVATAHVVEWLGAKVVLCDIDKDTLNIDINKAEKLITDKTKAIIPVHIGGYPCDLDSISLLAKKYNLKVIEDAAHAIGTKYQGIKIGSFSDITCFSFYATKNLAMGEGGAAVSKDKDIIKKMRSLGYFGINKDAFKRYEAGGIWQYDIEKLGYKYNMDNLNASLGLVQLQKLDEMNIKRQQIASIYRSELDERISFTRHIDHHTYHLFMIKVPKNIITRDSLFKELKNRKIGTSVHFIPLHMHSYYQTKFNKSDFEIANQVFEEILSLPIYPSMSDDDVNYVVEQINDILS